MSEPKFDPVMVDLNRYLDDQEKNETRREEKREEIQEKAREVMFISLGSASDIAKEALSGEWIQTHHYLIISAFIQNRDYESLGRYIAGGVVDYMLPQYWDDAEEQVLEQ